MTNRELFDLDFFIAGVPPSTLFWMDYEKATSLVDASEEVMGGNHIAELAMIGLAAYFEAFCKNQFAAVINICPQVLEMFASRRDGTTLRLKDLVHLMEALHHRFGSLLVEQYDFGSAKAINSLFYDLLEISPFSTREAKQYNEFLSDRNLLVHHGGVYTLKYQGQRFEQKLLNGDVYWNSLVIRKSDFKRWSLFLACMVRKLIETSYRALDRFITAEKIVLSPERRGALKFLSWIDEMHKVQVVPRESS
jgi:hypothetical protein